VSAIVGVLGKLGAHAGTQMSAVDEWLCRDLRFKGVLWWTPVPMGFTKCVTGSEMSDAGKFLWMLPAIKADVVTFPLQLALVPFFWRKGCNAARKHAVARKLTGDS
jgi:hypothetical protein